MGLRLQHSLTIRYYKTLIKCWQAQYWEQKTTVRMKMKDVIEFQRCAQNLEGNYGILLMSNKHWYQSPRLTSVNASKFLSQKEYYQEEDPILRTPCLFPLSHLSPFSPFNKQGQGESGQRRRNDMIMEENQDFEPIHRQNNFFSEEEDDEIKEEDAQDDRIQTPLQDVRIKEEYNSTGCKSNKDKHIEVKKTRPKDKGLRGLSSKAYKVVTETRSTSYKEVALKLLKDFNSNQELQTPADQTNVKRRVYDALNVLIAVGVLQKDGRRIVNRGKSSAGSRGIEDQISHMNQKLKAKEQSLNEKRKKLMEIKQKYRCIKNLLTRNRENAHLVKLTGRYVQFPFVGVTSFSKYTIWTPTTLQIVFDSQIYFFGDTDSLSYI